MPVLHVENVVITESIVDSGTMSQHKGYVKCEFQICIGIFLTTLFLGVNWLYLPIMPTKDVHRLMVQREFWHKLNTSEQILDVVVTFPYMLDPDWDSPGYGHLSRSRREARMDEYLSSLNRTLIHPRVKVVHLLYDQTPLEDYVKSILPKFVCSKLIFHRTNNTRLAISTFQFAFEKLRGHLVMVSQADVYPASGFDLINPDLFHSRRLMYALTRHGRLEERCDMSGDFCDEGRKYVGSHDSYIFVPQGQLTKSFVQHLSTDTMAWGIDLVITWAFEKKQNYHIINPCKVIIIYHIHCTFIRNAQRQRVNTVNTTGWVIPSSDLY